MIQEDVVSELQERLETMKAEVRVLCVFFGWQGMLEHSSMFIWFYRYPGIPYLT